MAKSSLVLLCLLLALLPAASCAPKTELQPGEEVVVGEKSFSFEAENYPTEQDLFPTYLITPGDLLDVLFQVRSWQGGRTFRIAVDHTVSIKFVHLPELNETQNVQPDGRISLPYIGTVEVVGKTPDELRAELMERYATVLRQPELYVVVPEFSGQIKELKKDLHTATRGLSRLVTVRPDGFATFPLVGDVFVTGRTVPEVNDELNKRYNDYMLGLHVDLFLEKTAGSVVYVSGQVRNPSSYRMEKPITIVQALTLAGGHRTEASLDSVLVFRRHAKKFVVTRVDVSRTLRGDESAHFFFLRPDDIVYVPRTRLGTMAEIMGNIADVFLFRGWSLSGTLFKDYVFELNSDSRYISD
jgi:polysaccharide export outer membrane protein